MSEFESKTYWMMLSKLHGMTDRLALDLVETFGGIEELFKLDEESLIRKGALSPRLAAKLAGTSDRNLRQIEDGILYLEEEGFSIVSYGCSSYPSQLRTIPRPPLILFNRGRLHAEFAQCTAIVGARQATPEALTIARMSSRILAAAGYSIVSGLAVGIDAEAHAGALDEGGNTIAVLGCGADRPDPLDNEALYYEILQAGGAIVSEYPPGSPPSARRYLQRNRITSGLSSFVIIVQARTKSGTYGTADAALKQHRILMAIDWPQTTEETLGNRRLIDEGLAFPISPDNLDALPEYLETARNAYYHNEQLDLFEDAEPFEE